MFIVAEVLDIFPRPPIGVRDCLLIWWAKTAVKWMVVREELVELEVESRNIMQVCCSAQRIGVGPDLHELLHSCCACGNLGVWALWEFIEDLHD